MVDLIADSEKKADDKKGYTPPQKKNNKKNDDLKRDTAFRRSQGFRRTCGRWQ